MFPFPRDSYFAGKGCSSSTRMKKRNEKEIRKDIEPRNRFIFSWLIISEDKSGEIGRKQNKTNPKRSL